MKVVTLREIVSFQVESANKPEAELTEFETPIKYIWFNLKLYSMFQDLSRRSIGTGFNGFKMQLKFNKFGHRRL